MGQEAASTRARGLLGHDPLRGLPVWAACPFPRLPLLASPLSHSQKGLWLPASQLLSPNQIRAKEEAPDSAPALASRSPQPAAAPNPFRKDPGSQRGRDDGGSGGRLGWGPSPASLSGLFGLLGASVLSQGGPALCSGTKEREYPPANSRASERGGFHGAGAAAAGAGARALGWEP